MPYIKPLLNISLIVMVMSIYSCKPEVCEDVICANEGICSGGVCQCPEGYEGVRCETFSRDKFLGTYSVAEDGTLSQPANYSTNIHTTDDLPVNTVRLKGFYNYFEDQVTAICSGDSMIIPNQALEDGYRVEGYGIFTQQDYYANHGKLEVFYKVYVPTGEIDDFGIDRGGSSEWSK